MNLNFVWCMTISFHINLNGAARAERLKTKSILYRVKVIVQVCNIRVFHCLGSVRITNYIIKMLLM